jgi:membrane-bound acyltransferase YfiQ involved in biofilm formation
MGMFWWTDRYQAVSVPNFDQLGTLPYYALRAIQQLTLFSVPSFLFFSGFFVSYMGRSSQTAMSWKAVVARLRYVLIPYLIWSVVIFVGNALQGIAYSPTEYLWQLIAGKATGAYFFVPLLCQFYLLSPILLPFAKTKGRLFLLIAAFLQFGTMGIRYLTLYQPNSPVLNAMIWLTPDWSFVRWAFFFAIGLFCGLRLGWFRLWLSQLPWTLLLVLLSLGLSSLVEAELLFENAGDLWLGPLKLSSSLYAMVFILCFVRFARMPTSSTSFLNHLGKRSYAIYLLHPKILEFTARVVRQLAPQFLAYQLPFVALLFVLGLGGPLLLMSVVSRSPARRYYHYLFG